MDTGNLKYSRRTCHVFDKHGNEVGKIQFQRDPHFYQWRVKYLSDQLPVNSYDLVDEIKEKLLDNGYTWSWGRIKHQLRSGRYR